MCQRFIGVGIIFVVEVLVMDGNRTGDWTALPIPVFGIGFIFNQWLLAEPTTLSA
jgi:hypothetical protein